MSQKTECERSPDNPKRCRIDISCGRWFSKIIRKRLRIPQNPLWDGNPPWGERISAENVMAMEKSLTWRSKKMTKDSIRVFGPTQKLGKNFIYRHHIKPRSSTYVPREESFLISTIYIIEQNSSEKKYTMWAEDWRSQNIWGNTNSIVFGIAGQRRNSVPYYNFAQEFVPVKRS